MSEVLEIPSVLWPGAELGDWSRDADGASQARFVASPSASDIRQLIPWRPSSVRAAGARTSDDRPRGRRLRDSLGATALMTVGAMRRSHRVGVTGGSSLVDAVASTLGERGLRGIVMCGPARANQKPVVQLHDRFGRTVAFVKVAWNDLTRQLLDVEAGALDRLASIPDRPFQVPQVLARGRFGDATWIALARVSVGRRGGPVLATADRLAVEIEQTAERWDGTAEASQFVQRVANGAGGLTLTEPAVEMLCERWNGQRMTLAAAHGDFVPWNILSGTPRPAVWDWERYDPAVPVGFDRLHYRVQIGLHRRHEPIGGTIGAVARDLEHVLPELSRWQRRQHLEWYVVDLLGRYERDGVERHGQRWIGLVQQLSDALNELMKERRPTP